MEDSSGGVMPYRLEHIDALDWLRSADANSIEGVVTDPPYGIVEYQPEQLELRRNGKGIWRLPHVYDGSVRQPVPRFTVLSAEERSRLSAFYAELGFGLRRVLVPGAHVFIATNQLVSHIVYSALIGSGFEKRGEVVRIVQTLRGGDRPKNAHEEFPDVSVIPRSAWEPWGLFRKPVEGRIQDNLRKWRTGGLRRLSESEPFRDVVLSGRASSTERRIAPHPTLKPQAFLRQIVRAVLPLGEGTVLDPFMGSGSTIAAAAALGYKGIGLEVNKEYFDLASKAIPQLACLSVDTRIKRGLTAAIPEAVEEELEVSTFDLAPRRPSTSKSRMRNASSKGHV